MFFCCISMLFSDRTTCMVLSRGDIDSIFVVWLNGVLESFPSIVLQPPSPFSEGGGCVRSGEKGAQNEKIRQKIDEKRGKSKKYSEKRRKNGEVKLCHQFLKHINFAYIWSILIKSILFEKVGFACHFKIVKQIFLMLILECIKSARTSASYPLDFAHHNP